MPAHLVHKGLALLTIDALQTQLRREVEGFQDSVGWRVDVKLRQQMINQVSVRNLKVAHQIADHSLVTSSGMPSVLVDFRV